MSDLQKIFTDAQKDIELMLSADHEEEALRVMATAMANAREIGPDYETAKQLAWIAYSALIGAKFKIS